MYGIKPETDLSFLVGKDVLQVSIGPHDAQINYDGGNISIWSCFRLSTQDGLEFEWLGKEPSKAKELVRLVSTSIVGFAASSYVFKRLCASHYGR